MTGDDATPNPGSDEAVERGCTCSVYAALDSGVLYNYNLDCPLHGRRKHDHH